MEPVRIPESSDEIPYWRALQPKAEMAVNEPRTQVTDEELMRFTQGGDRNAFGTLFDRYNVAIFRYIYRMNGDRGHAESLAQETFLKVLKRAGSYRYPETVSTWVYTIARNVCIDFERKKGSRQPGLPEAVSSTLTDSGSQPLHVVSRDEELDEVRKAVAELPEIYREVMILRAFQRLPFKNIARIVDCPESTARSRMGYGLEMLRKRLADRES